MDDPKVLAGLIGAIATVVGATLTGVRSNNE